MELILLIVTVFALGILAGHILFADHLAERGEYAIGEGEQLSGWMHDGTLYVPKQDS